MVIVLLCMSFTNGFDDERYGGRGVMKKQHLAALQKVYLCLIFSFSYVPIAVMMVFQLQTREQLHPVYRLYPEMV